MRHPRIGQIALVTLAGAAAARTQTPFYIGGSVGAIFPTDTTHSYSLISPLTGARTPGGEAVGSYDPGFDTTLSFGIRLPANFRLDAEAGYARFEKDQIMAGPPLRRTYLNQSGGVQNWYTGQSTAIMISKRGLASHRMLAAGSGSS